jgi:RND family efflux transporter MFP subunit
MQKGRNMKRRIIQIGLFFLIIIISLAVVGIMIARRKPPARIQFKTNGALVETTTIKAEDKTVIVKGHGIIIPRRAANIVPQVSGQIVWVNPRFVEGGIFKKGDCLFKIEKIDYETAVKQVKAELKDAEYQLAKIESDARVARLQWNKWQARGNNHASPPNPLVLYGPQLERAKAIVDAKKATLKQAMKNLERTRVTTPFNCMIRTETLDLGQYVRSGETLGNLFETDVLEVEVPLELSRLAWLNIPREGETGKGSPARISLKVDSDTCTWDGVVNRSLGEVTPNGRMVRVIVEVKNPYKRIGNKRRPDPALGMFVDVSFVGKTIRNVIPIPIAAVRDNKTVWTVNKNNTLHTRQVRWAWSDNNEVWVIRGLHEGEKIITSSLAAAVEGMKVRTLKENNGLFRETDHE